MLVGFSADLDDGRNRTQNHRHLYRSLCVKSSARGNCWLSYRHERPLAQLRAQARSQGGGARGGVAPLEIISPPLESAGLFFAGLFFCLLVIQLFATCYARFNLNLIQLDST